MQLTNDFDLSLPPDETYRLLLDLESVTPCMPGATLGSELPDGAREVTVTVKIGPMRFTYNGTVRIADRDDAQRKAVLLGTANEARGQGSATALITMQVTDDAGASHVSVISDIELTGRAAQMGHGMVESVSKLLIGQFTTRLSERFIEGSGRESVGDGSGASAPDDDALEAGSLVWAAMRDRVSQPFRRRERGEQ